jgi:centromere protein X
MPPKKTTSAGPSSRGAKTAARSRPAATKGPRGRPSNGSNRSSTGVRGNARGSTSAREVVTIDSDDNEQAAEEDDIEDEDMEEESDGGEARATIPPELITRVLHEFFAKDGTRITRDANEAVVRYVDVFVREAIARTAAEKDGGFLEVSFFLGIPMDGWRGLG